MWYSVKRGYHTKQNSPLNTHDLEPNAPLKVRSLFALTCSSVSVLSGESAGSTDEPKGGSHLSGGTKISQVLAPHGAYQ